MFLQYFHIKGFRGIDEINLTFNPNLNIIIGENNTCKTAIIDALRICFNLGQPRKEIYVDSEDFYKRGLLESNYLSNGIESIEFDLYFTDLTEEERTAFYELLVLDNDEIIAQLHVRFTKQFINNEEKIRQRCWGGEHEGANVSQDTLEFFYSVYLGALRDAERDLAPSKNGRLGKLFSKIRSIDQQKDVTSKINEKIESIEEVKILIEEGSCHINRYLERTTILNDPQSIKVNLLPIEYKKLLDHIKLCIPLKIHKEIVTEIFPQICLEKFFVNPKEDDLIFKAEFIQELETDSQLTQEEKDSFKEKYYSSLFELTQNGLGYNNLIYIATVLCDLGQRNSSFYTSLLIEEPEAHLHPQLQDIVFNFFRDKGNERQIQVFLTSHSPTITAKANIGEITVLQKKSNSIHSIALQKIHLQEKHKQYLQRFLDVTKCQLFFAKGVILVEGISEALLLPIFADIMGASSNIDQQAIEIINIGGVAFEPFAKLFNSNNENLRLNVRCAIVTDKDEERGGDPRINNIKTLETGLTKVFLAENTFEYELVTAGNQDIIISTYKEMHPRTELTNENSIATEFVRALRSNKDKAEFAQLLTLKLMENSRLNFIVPKYLQDAIRWVINGHNS